MALIVVADDTSATCDLIRAICHYGGHQTLEAESAKQALQLTHAYHPDLIITDVHMFPTSGLELLDTLKHEAQLPVIPVVVTSMTGAMSVSEPKAYRLGAAKFITGPLEVESLLATIEECLRSPP
jgi:two-component system, OmpR family, response regulator